VILSRLEVFQESDRTPAAADNDNFRLLEETLCFLVLLIVQENLGDLEVLLASAPRRQRDV
jgi:hypothetical protein